MAGEIFFILTGIAIAICYFPMANKAVSWPRSLLKTFPLLCFAAAAYLAQAPAFLALALFLSALGDFALSRNGRRAFLYGLSAFAMAHLVYIILLLDVANADINDAFMRAPQFAILLIMFALSSELWLAPYVGNLRWPVRGYIVLITYMGLAALAQPMQIRLIGQAGESMVLNQTAWVIRLGAGLFILSDFILALREFRLNKARGYTGIAGWGVWLFYIAGQALITAAIAL